MVKEKVSFGGLLVNDEDSISLSLLVAGIAVEVSQIDVACDVYVMYKQRFVLTCILQCMTDTSACVKQELSFVTDADISPEVLVGLQEVDDLFSKVVYIDDNPVEPVRPQLEYEMLE